MSNTTYLSPVKFNVGTKVVLTGLGLKNLKSLFEEYPWLQSNTAPLTITKVVTTMAEDEHTELLEETVGATELKNSKGEVVAITKDNDDLWAFFTEHTPHYFHIV